MDKIATLKKLINTYYNVCDDINYLNTCTPHEAFSQRKALVNVMYNLIYGTSLFGSNSRLMLLLNNDIIGERYTAEQIIYKLNIHL